MESGINLNDKKIPEEAIRALGVITELLDDILVGVYLYGSAATGGLRVDGDVDILAVADGNLSEGTRKNLTQRLMLISGKIGNTDRVRPLEVTVVNQKNIIPWQFPPRYEFMYGEWLRGQFEKRKIPEPTYDPDLAILLFQARENSINLYGPKASEILEPMPMADIRRAIKESLPGLVASIKGDERNVILTLARMWQTAAIGEISSKDQAARWVVARLPEEYAALLDVARRAYSGESTDRWEGMEVEISSFVDHMKESIESCL